MSGKSIVRCSSKNQGNKLKNRCTKSTFNEAVNVYITGDWDMKYVYVWISILFCLSALSTADTTFTSTAMQYSIYLPDNWVVDATVDSQHYFYDTSGTYGAFLFASRSKINATDYATPEEWTRAHHIAYDLLAQNSYDPWGIVLYSDSSASRTISDLWAPVTYAHYVSTDTAWGSWREYVRYVATDSYGYEFSWWGDTTDMQTNIGLYAAMVGSVQLSAKLKSRVAPPVREYQRVHSEKPEGEMYIVDPLGRVVMPASSSRDRARGVYISNRGKRIVNIRH